MSDEDFFRGLRDDIVDSTRKMMEEAPVSKGKAKVKKPDKEVNQKVTDPAKQGPAEGDAVAKVTMELVQLSIENKPEEKDNQLLKAAIKQELDTSNPEEPPLEGPEVTGQTETAKRSKKKATRKEEKLKDKKQKETKQLEAKYKESKRKEAKLRKKEAKMARSHGTPEDDDSDESFDTRFDRKLEINIQQLAALQGEINKLEKQIVSVQTTFSHRDAKASTNRTETHKHSQQEAKGACKEKKTKSNRFEAESGKSDAKRKDRKHEHALKPAQEYDTEPVSAEQQLLLKLFMLSSSQRKKYIEKRGVELGLLEPHPFKRHVITVAERVQTLSETLFVEGQSYIIAPTLIGDKADPPLRGESFKTKQESRPFEEQVTYLLNNGKQCAVENYNPELTLTSSSVRDEAQMIVQDRLDAFVDELVETRVGYLVEGMLRVNARNNLQSFVDDASREGNVYINSILLRRCAMDGDRVRVFVMNGPVVTTTTGPPLDQTGASTSETDGDASCLDASIDSAVEEDTVQPKPPTTVSQNNVGFVVKILEKRNSRQCVGKFLPSTAGKKHYRTFMPRDTRIPPVRVFRQDWPNALIDTKPTRPPTVEGGDSKESKVTDVTEVLYQAEIIEWQDDVPIGTILKSIGKCGVLEVESESILVEYNLDVTPYGNDILAQLPAVPYSIPHEEIARRTDLRGECIFTIDPATARDLDDALSCKVLPNGNFEVGVHISDVTYFLREESELDELVKLRATSIYMVDSVYHMLPKQLCNTCSLLPGEDKLAFSVFWEILPDGTVLSTRFARSVINSCAQLSYEHAQMMLDNAQGQELEEDLFPEILHGHTAQSLGVVVNQLQSIAVKLRQRRMDDGCLKINQPKLTFRLDPATGRPIEYGVYKLRASNELIEDFMLLANTSVARAIHGAFPAISLLRNHKPPAENMMKNLVRTLATHGHTFSFASSKAIRESMETIIAEAEHPDGACSVLNVLLSKPMTRALYYCSAFASEPQHFRHYALAIPMYTHFTSPIRRYADCLVHRVLAATLGIDDEPKRTPDEVQKLATICNEKKYNAKLAGDASSMLYYRHWLRTVRQHETVGAVLGYGAHFVELVLIHSGIAVKASTKKIAAVASVAFKPVEPVGILRLIPKDASIQPVTLKLFTKVRVTIKLVHDAITVCSILPLLDEVPTVSDSNPEASQLPSVRPADDVASEMKSARVY